MIDRVQTKQAVRARLQGCWGRLFLACVIPSVAPWLLQYFTGNINVEIPLPGGIVLTVSSPAFWLASMALSVFVVLPMQVSLSSLLMRFLQRYDQPPVISEVFTCFSEGYTAVLKGMSWYWWKMELWGLLYMAAQIISYLVGDGIMALLLLLAALIWQVNRTYAYCMTPYIVAERPGISGREALRLSCEMTRGRIWELVFALGISFFGWILLGVVTFGVALIYALPYMRGVEAAYYLHMRPESWGPLTLREAQDEADDGL